ncbi:MAG TPA: copper resistance protein B, partial [Gammaproteobacteria bacterium]|nr:copper resistance protein B [Gammaproteobacteria bacterium]
RAFAVLGLQGLAPYWFETDTALFISEEGDISFRGEFEYELLFTQRLILTPQLEFTLAAQDVPEYDIGSGLTRIEIGLRLRYEIQREFAPYIGISYEQLYGGTKAIAIAADEKTSRTTFVLGIRAWF